MDRRATREPARSDDVPAADRRAADREARLAAALRANLRRRKAQSRARQDAPEDSLRPGPSSDADEGGGT